MPGSLQLLSDPRDPVLAAAKRVFAFGDPIVLERRAAELASAAAVPLGALDLGLLNWARRTDDPAAPRIVAGSRARARPGRASARGRGARRGRGRSARAARRSKAVAAASPEPPVN